MSRPPIASACALAAALACASSALADDDPQNSPAAVSQVLVTGQPSIAALDHLPNTTASVTADKAADQVNLVTVEDALRYLPDILIRQRHIGDDQNPVTTRTSGVGASARSLIYADGMLLSALIGNNNTSASPKWSVVAPNAISRVDVIYGPFAAQYPGNSIGEVIEITTRAPTGPEASIEAQGAGQTFHKYADDATYGTGRVAATLGDRLGGFSFRTAYSHLDTHAQPLTYAIGAIPTATGTAGAPVTGAYLDANRAGVPVEVLGSTALAHQVQDTLTARLTYDITPTLTAAYTAGFFRNDEHDGVNSYLRDAAGQPVYAGAVNLNGRAYTLANSVFSNGVYRFEEDELSQGLSLASHTGGLFDFELIGTTFDNLKSRQRIPSGALPAAFGGGPGSTVSLDGTGWWTLDGKGTWRPAGLGAGHVVTFGAHSDSFKLNNPRYALTGWVDGSAGATTTFSRGRTETQAVWAQDAWRMAPDVSFTFGGRWEHWDAYNGLNFSASPRLNTLQPTQHDWRFSPKGVLAFTPIPEWIFKASVGVAYRFPTVQELYQAVTAGPILTTPNPNLRPEHDVSAELSAERDWRGGHARLSLFGERIDDALISQTGLLANGPNTFTSASFTQNVERTSAKGVELVAGQDDVVIHGLSLEGWITYVDGRIDRDPTDVRAIGRLIPQLPHLRGAMTATYRPGARWALTLAGRYSDRSYGTIENTDTYANTYTGFSAFFVADAHVRYRVTSHLSAEVGCDNLLDRIYFLYHPFTGRTVIGDLKYDF